MIAGMIMALNAPRANPIQRAINILKSAGPGAWYDPSDLTTLFQDSAGTTPVTAVEQPVGLILDKSQGLVLGAELFTGTYTLGAATTATYSGSEATATFGGSLTVSSNYWLSIPGNAAANGYSEIEFWATYVSGGNLEVGRSWDAAQTITAASNVGVRTRYKAQICSGYSSGSSGRATFGSTTAGSVWKIEIISVRELPGSHLIQPTATSRPTLSSRYNLLTKTEQFDDVHWTKTTGTTVTASSATAPDGTLTADTVAYNGTGASGSYRLYSGVAPISIPGAGYTAKVWLRADAPVTIAISGNTVAGVVTSVNVTTDWQQFTISGTGDGVSMAQFIIYSPAGNNAAFQVYAWGASVTNASDASLPYQRVNTATDYDFDFSKFPPYLKFDGVDDSLYTSAIDFTSTDKVTVFAGVHKASDAGIGVLAETSTGALSGSFWLSVPATVGGPNVLFQSKGTIEKWAITSSLAAPLTRVVTGVGDISGDRVTLRLNGTQTSQDATDQGTGNYGNYPLYVGRRNNASLPFNGRLYQLAIKGKALSAAEIATVESFVNSKTKAY